MGLCSGGGFEGDGVAESFEFADMAVLAPFGVGAGGVVAGAEVVEAGAGVRQQVPVALCSPGGWRDAKGPAGLAGRALAGVGSGVLLFEDALEGVVLGRVVGGAGLPAAPDDVDPGAGQDAHGVRVVFAAGAGVVVEGRGPGAGVA